jgi:hypothetical protein
MSPGTCSVRRSTSPARRLDGQGTPEVTEGQPKERAGHSAREPADELAEPTRRSRPSFAVEAIWFDTYLRGDDVRVAMGAPPVRGPGLRGAVHQVAGHLEQGG